MLAFFRDPERETDRLPDVLYAAADGLVREVDEVSDPAMPGGRAMRISTFLSLHNVHVNRSPVGGEVRGVEEIGGGYHPALFRRSEENRRNRIEISGPRGPVVVIQKAGLIARRISTWVEEGDRVEPGGKLGLIHLGSRTDVLLPAGTAEPLVRPGDTVRAGLTPLARYGDAG
jgi:phosphatidylserine decarboxylase